MTTSGAHVCRVDNFYDVGNTCIYNLELRALVGL